MEERKTEPISTTSQRSGNVLQTIFRGLLRLILVLLVGSLLGAAVYLGFVYGYKRMIVQPANRNLAQIQQVETRQALAQERIGERLTQYNERLTGLESQQTFTGEDISGIQSSIQDLETALEEQSLILERVIELETAIEELETTTDELTQDIIENNEDTAILRITLTSSEVDGEQDDGDLLFILKRDVQALHAMELLNRARLYLIQSNLGLAEQDVEFARQVLLRLYADAPVYQQEIYL